MGLVPLLLDCSGPSQSTASRLVILIATCLCALQGIWGGMIAGICLQTTILIVIVATRNWEKEVSISNSPIYDFIAVVLRFTSDGIRMLMKFRFDFQASEAESRVRKWGGNAANH